jgi:dTDP-4-amino-4,6-dideoxygalactose transaminase
VAACGATPVFVDVDRDTFNIDCGRLKEAIEKVEAEGKLCPRAVIPVDLFGQPADFAAIEPLAASHDLLVLEDGAQGFGGRQNKRRACSFGDISTTSFFPAKPLGCYGDGGAIFTDNEEWAAKIRSLCVHGKGSFKYDNVRIGVNSRLDTLQAAILLVKFKAFRESELEAVNRAAACYTEKLQTLGETPEGAGVKTPVIAKECYSSWAQYTITLPDKETRDRLQQTLKEQGIPSMIYYPKALHRQQAFAYLGAEDEGLTTTLKLCDTVLALPMHPYLRSEDIDRVVKGITDGLRGRKQ